MTASPKTFRTSTSDGSSIVENEKISTSASGGETCGIDLALRVVDRYFGRKVAEQTAVYTEHEGKGWVMIISLQQGATEGERRQAHALRV